MQSNAIQAAKTILERKSPMQSRQPSQFQKEIEKDTINIWLKGERTWGKNKRNVKKKYKNSRENNIQIGTLRSNPKTDLIESNKVEGIWKQMELLNYRMHFQNMLRNSQV